MLSPCRLTESKSMPRAAVPCKHLIAGPQRMHADAMSYHGVSPAEGAYQSEWSSNNRREQCQLTAIA